MQWLAPFASAISLGLWLWAAVELSTLWRTRPRNIALYRLPSVRQYRLSTAAAVIGIANGGLYLLHGSWTYTAAFRSGAGSLAPGGAPQFSLFLAVICGMTLSTLQRGSFRLDWRIRRSWLMSLTGGILMGSGAALVPGGNDTLLLYGIPAFSGHAFPAYIAMLIGVAIVLVAMRSVFGIRMHVNCEGDLCRTDSR